MKKTILSILIFTYLIVLSTTAHANVGKVVITGFKGTSPQEKQIQKLKSYIDQELIGGIILFKRNIENKQQLIELISYLKSSTDIFVVIDHEGGIVNRLTHPSFDLKTPSPESFCKLPRNEQLKIANKITTTLTEVGINTNLGGVVDIAPYLHQSSICKYKRCFSDSQDEISNCTSVLSQSHDESDIMFALKHFPGHGSTSIDSHYNLPDISKTHSEYDFMPYYQLFNQETNNQMVMTGHLMNNHIDENLPASLSKLHIDYLKGTLNYQGLIITDDLNMGALYKYSRNKTTIAKMAFEAGNHLLLFEYLTFQQIDEINAMILDESNTSHLFKDHLLSSIDLIESKLIFDD